MPDETCQLVTDQNPPRRLIHALPSLLSIHDWLRHGSQPRLFVPVLYFTYGYLSTSLIQATDIRRPQFTLTSTCAQTPSALPPFFWGLCSGHTAARTTVQPSLFPFTSRPCYHQSALILAGQNLHFGYLLCYRGIAWPRLAEVVLKLPAAIIQFGPPVLDSDLCVFLSFQYCVRCTVISLLLFILRYLLAEYSARSSRQSR